MSSLPLADLLRGATPSLPTSSAIHAATFAEQAPVSR
jgi:hypothetical protein